MSIKKAIIATTALDAHNERMSLDCLKGMVEQVNTHTILMNIEHDPRIPPIGRIISGKVVNLDNNEYGVEAEIELFDEESKLEDAFKNRPLRCDDDFKLNSVRLGYDRNFDNENDRKTISDISTILKSKPQYQVKKALEPLSILEIGGGFVLGCIASGFFSQIGSDGYNLLKEKIKNLFSEEKFGEKERLLEFSFSVIMGDRKINCKVILTNPKSSEIDSIFDSGLKEFDKIVEAQFELKRDYKLIVFEYKNGQFEPKYAVTNDGSTYSPREK
jgi:hypothetical protein